MDELWNLDKCENRLDHVFFTYYGGKGFFFDMKMNCIDCMPQNLLTCLCTFCCTWKRCRIKFSQTNEVQTSSNFQDQSSYLVLRNI